MLLTFTTGSCTFEILGKANYPAKLYIIRSFIQHFAFPKISIVQESIAQVSTLQELILLDVCVFVYQVFLYMGAYYLLLLSIRVLRTTVLCTIFKYLIKKANNKAILEDIGCNADLYIANQEDNMTTLKAQS